MCKVGEIVVVGGVRRSALISLSDLSNREISHAKSGNWWESNGQRALANNSVSYDKKPDVGTFMKEWLSLYDSKSGERGIFNREAAKMKVLENGRRDAEHEFGCNPCSEIILRPYQFCNLSEVVVRPTDNLDDLKRKVRIATTLGTFQSTLTNFKYLRKIWEKNTKEERLLGVSLTGIMDHNVLSKTVDSVRWLREMKQAAVDQNAYLAGEIGIEVSTAITCVKPSGTVSQLVDAASGIHARHNPHYVRTVRGDNKDPLTQFLISKGVPSEPDVMKPDTTTVFSFLTRSPDTSSCRNDMTALEQLELWKLYAIHWCEHKPSVTISVKEHEWIAVGAWVYDNFDLCSGISFLPFSDHTYKQAPYQDITKKEYDGGYQLIKDQDGKENKMDLTCPSDLNWVDLEDFEKQDNTNGNRELACSADACEVVDIGVVQ
jgi:ribonucleoside-diphosphate reductase alpha chain